MKPVIPVVEGFEIFADDLPCHQYSSGDFYHITQVNQDEIAIAMCELHWGLTWPPPELFAKMASEVKQAIVTPLAPTRILEHLDAVFRPILNPPDSLRCAFLTMSLVVLNMRDGSMTMANSGQPWMVIRRTDGSLEFPDREINGRVIGLDVGDDAIKAEHFFETRKTRLDPGDAAIIYSGGVIEASDIHGNWFGGMSDDMRTFGDVIARTDGGPKAIGEAVMNRLFEFIRGVTRSDDVALICFGPRPDFRPAAT